MTQQLHPVLRCSNVRIIGGRVALTKHPKEVALLLGKPWFQLAARQRLFSVGPSNCPPPPPLSDFEKEEVNEAEQNVKTGKRVMGSRAKEAQ